MATNANANGIPFLKRTGIPPAIKNSMVVYYDIKKQGCTNESMKANPVLKDFSGNGNDGQCNGFAWNHESGIGEFVFKDFITYNNNVKIKENIITINANPDKYTGGIELEYTKATRDTPSTKVKIVGIKGTIFLRYVYRNSEGKEITIKITKDGNYNFPKSFNTIEGDGAANSLYLYNPDKIETVVTIEQLDYYKDAICTDGVDDYIYSEYLRINNKGFKFGTIVFDANFIDEERKAGIIIKDIFDIYNHNTCLKTYVKNNGDAYVIHSKDIISITTDDDFYKNNMEVYRQETPNSISSGNHEVFIGGGNPENNNYTKMYLRRIAVFNRVLTADEIKYVYEKIFGCKLKTMEERVEDSIILHYDIAKQGATNESMKSDPRLVDLSGNGNDAVLNNFSWRLQSGIGSYPVEVFVGGNIPLTTAKFTITNKNKIHITHSPDVLKTSIYEYRIPIGGSIKATKIKVSNLNGFTLLGKNGFLSITITEDGIYDLPEVINTQNNPIYPAFYIQEQDVDCDITIELLPEYPNALVFDGVDDYGVVEDVPIFMPEVGFTIIAKRKILDTGKYCVASCSPGDSKGAFLFELGAIGAPDSMNILYPNTAIYSFGKGIHTAALQTNDISYMKSNQYNDIALNKGSDNSTSPLYIGRRTATDSRILKGVIYSLMLFNRDLTIEEIEFVKQKYFND